MVIQSSILLASIFIFLSISTKLGVAPQLKTAPADAMYVNGDIKTSSPGPIPNEIQHNFNAAVPEEQARAYLQLKNFLNSFSNLSLLCNKLIPSYLNKDCELITFSHALISSFPR